MDIQSIIEAKKPFFISWDLLDEIIKSNLSFLAMAANRPPLDVMGPGRFHNGMRNLCDYAKIKVTPQPDYTYLIEDAK